MLNSIVGTNKSRQASEKAAALIVSVCAAFSIVAVVAITAYMIYSGTPALAKVGIGNILFKTEWVPSQGKFGILYIILTSIVGTLLAVLIAIPVGLFTAAALSEMVTGTPKKIMKAAIELLAGIPSVVYGLLGILIINPQMYKLEKFFYHTSHSHQFTGGANLIAAIIVLVIMILPTLINVSETALETVPNHLRLSSYALGSTKIQTIFKVVIPAAKNGIMSAIVLGVGRAIGEAMAILLVAGNAVNLPAPFNSVRFLTTAIVSEMSYSSGVHRQVLFTIGLVLFIFIMVINIVLMKILKKGEENG
ncbi:MULTISPECIES: phosphate ABC transporter permease subunit PstC [Catenibacterium]|uniref:Phosphate transport system permease protein n=1 Tax=Catenibacterium faecis TaxID=2764323 RepID=A0ABR7KDN5_9FIRM|nr:MULTISPECIES: phosphate ABC transporter permease subunit PstC [unclassified Catenibacterium]MBC6010572.1 phosphate ABC transporter permease subunit PstC [Catenibacterium faecis]MBD9189886.1 phosphate ABC transporter permease subunit PstC [Catenibacterium mitsuokai]RGE99111.1 phosphate ABC transporter permease subunit PstC [Catenibacterium sp. AM22-6LB]RGF08906.1 phosphate ABC transporter permease subunit PstC [Catenibacterium sp. AM22-15]